MLTLGVIPARMGSTRFPGKPLADLAGRPLLAHVVAHARQARTLTRLLVATDALRIAEVAREAGVEARLTPESLRSGSDRVAWVERELAQEGERYEAVVNIQGDEPLLPASAIDAAVLLLAARPGAQMATLAVPCAEAEAADPNVVKVVLDGVGRALYFSRSAVPFPRRREDGRWLRHLGVYAFRSSYLERFVDLPEGTLERTEGLEQLRALEDGACIVVEIGAWPALGVDTALDLERAQEHLRALESWPKGPEARTPTHGGGPAWPSTCS